jgi:hypothetical protein
MLITVGWGQFKPSQPPRRVAKVGPNQTVTTTPHRRTGGATSNRPAGANSGCHGQKPVFDPHAQADSYLRPLASWFTTNATKFVTTPRWLVIDDVSSVGQGSPARGRDEVSRRSAQSAAPQFVVEMLRIRRRLSYLGERAVIFPSTAGTLRGPNNFGKEWRSVREELGVPEVTTHSLRKTVATLIDDDGLSARIGADHLGHSKVSMTQDSYMTRGRVYTQVADLLDRIVAKSGE